MKVFKKLNVKKVALSLAFSGALLTQSPYGSAAESPGGNTGCRYQTSMVACYYPGPGLFWVEQDWKFNCVPGQYCSSCMPSTCGGTPWCS